MRRIYVASSWRNRHQPGVVAALRAAGHEVYDFRNPAPDNDGFRWSEIDPDWQTWDARAYAAALEHPIAIKGHAYDFEAMRWADTCVLVLPSGRSASYELGWCMGAGKRGIVLVAEPCEPELMYRGATIVGDMAGVLTALEQ